MSRHSVVDVGSNTIHLLVGEVDDGAVLPVTGEKVSARLGAGVEKTGRLDDERLVLATEAITLFASIAAMNGAPSPEILATSAVRDAGNGQELVDRVREATGLKMRLISGEKEAALGFRGALSAVTSEGRVLVVDLGGGSAQLIYGDARGGPEEQVSLPLGTNRTTERFVREDPPTDEELGALREHAGRLLPAWDIGEAKVVAVGGSARAILKIARDGTHGRSTLGIVRGDSRTPVGCSCEGAWARAGEGQGLAGGHHHARDRVGALRKTGTDGGARGDQGRHSSRAR